MGLLARRPALTWEESFRNCMFDNRKLLSYEDNGIFDTGSHVALEMEA